VHKLVPVWLVGKRTLANAKQLSKRLKNRLDGHVPFFTSDELPHYADALLAGYGVLVIPPRRFTRGRSPKPRLEAPSELIYAVVIKQREHGRVVQVTTQVIFGTEADVKSRLKTSPVSATISTYGVERNNLTVRQHSRRLGRKVNAFSRELCMRRAAPQTMKMLRIQVILDGPRDCWEEVGDPLVREARKRV
jgi:hypothetical protein